MEQEKQLKAISNMQADMVSGLLQKSGNDHFELGHASIPLLRALFAANGYKWDGYFQLSEGVQMGANFNTMDNPVAIKLTDNSTNQVIKCLLSVDNESLRLLVNDGRENPPFANGSSAWVKTQTKAFGKEYVDALRRVWRKRIGNDKQAWAKAATRLKVLENLIREQVQFS